MTSVGALLGALLSLQAELDPALPDYVAGSRVSGTIRFVGSDALHSFLILCGDEFRKVQPQSICGIEGSGDLRGGLKSFLDSGRICPWSHPLAASEIDAIEKKHGRKPVQVDVLYMALSVIVHKDNPLESLTLGQVDAIFSSTRKRGYKEDITTWGQLGLKEDWENRPLELVGRNSASTSYGQFKRWAMDGGDYKEALKEQPGSSFASAHVARLPSAIGYSGITDNPQVKVLALAPKEGDKPLRPTPDAVLKGAYPLAGPLSLLLLPDAEGRLDPLRKEFLRFVFSKQGQAQVLKDGYVPLTAAMAKEQLNRLGIEK